MEQRRETLVLPPTTEVSARTWSLRRRLSASRQIKELVARSWMMLVSIAACLLIVVITLALYNRSRPLLESYPLSVLLTGTAWQPMRGLFGFAPFIIGSIAVTTVAMVVAVVPAILSGIYMAEYTSSRTRNWLKPLLDLMVGIPSVVYGLWGILFIVPLVRDHIGPWSDRTLGEFSPLFVQTNSSGYGLLAAGFVLGIMVFPLIAAVTEEVLRSVPREMREAVVCLGATKWETTRCVVRRRGMAGIVAAVVLGFSRAYGETLAVMMLIGNTVTIPRSLFDTAYSLPALIANNYGEMMSVPLYESALMGAALALLVVVVFFNILARLVVNRLTQRS